MREALRARLLADSGVAALVGDRVSWAARPRAGALPAIALHMISAERQYALGGSSGLVRSRVQADCWGLTYAAATKVARAVLADLSGLRDAAMRVQGTFAVDERDLVDEEGSGASEILYRVSLDFMIWHEGT